MNPSSQLLQAPPRADDGLMLARAEEASFAPQGAKEGFGARFGLPLEAVTILEDVRRAMERNRPEGARIAALRLVSLLTPPPEAGPVCARGGLAPWQRRKIERYVREHLERPVQIEELAEHIPLSVSHFCRAFKETFRNTPHAYLIRLRRARQRLRRPGSSLQAVPAGDRRDPERLAEAQPDRNAGRDAASLLGGRLLGTAPSVWPQFAARMPAGRPR